MNPPECLSGYNKIRKLGCGTYGEVWLYEKDRKQYAIKFEHQNNQTMSLLQEKVNLRQMWINSNGKELNISRLNLFEYSQSNEKNQGKSYISYLVLDFYPQTFDSLYMTMFSKSDDLKYQYVTQTIKLLQQFHQKALFIHRDIKPDNFMGKDKQLYLIDFGTAKKSFNIIKLAHRQQVLFMFKESCPIFKVMIQYLVFTVYQWLLNYKVFPDNQVQEKLAKQNQIGQQ
ncbi:ck1 family protein kinase [Stylonychia lemnae]|uniref:Casein kinase I n=1 Tax=Stylonychia lemnae TaxID=5949 RepID=A0A078B1Z5_STYLE|nr:ck1 family protein kinase [Stylonychia lemnae]|eukprot:CDW88575.1 ck1 family protein kinase [Stylonychia lemnae]